MVELISYFFITYLVYKNFDGYSLAIFLLVTQTLRFFDISDFGINNGLSILLPRFLTNRNKIKINELFVTGHLFVFISSILTLLVFVLIKDALIPSSFDNEQSTIFINIFYITLLAIFIRLNLSIGSTIILSLRRSSNLSSINIFFDSIKMISIFIFFLFENPNIVDYAILSSVLIILRYSIIYFFGYKFLFENLNVKFIFSYTLLKKMLILSFWLVITSFSPLLMYQFPQIVFSKIATSEEFLYLSTSILLFCNIIPFLNFIRHQLRPLSIKHISKKNIYIDDLSSSTIFFTFIIFIIIIYMFVFFGKTFLELLFPKFSDNAIEQIFSNIYILLIFFGLSIPGHILRLITDSIGYHKRVAFIEIGTPLILSMLIIFLYFFDLLNSDYIILSIAVAMFLRGYLIFPYLFRHLFNNKYKFILIIFLITILIAFLLINYLIGFNKIFEFTIFLLSLLICYYFKIKFKTRSFQL